MLTAQHLTFIRNEILVLRNINFTLQASELLQVSGANGAGKTTLLKLIAGLLTASEGEIQWHGADITLNRSAYYRELIYLEHRAVIKADLTVYENLQWMKSLCEQSPRVTIEVALQQVALKDHSNTLAKNLSAGQQRRLGLAKLILFPAVLWLLDEPFTALDKAGCELLETLFLQHLQNRGMVVLTSHQALSERLPVHRRLELGMITDFFYQNGRKAC